MKHIFLNLKRFDIPCNYNGVNKIADIKDWADYIVTQTQEKLEQYKSQDVEFTAYFPEAHLISALKAKKTNSAIEIGCQSIYREDTKKGGNFGAFTTNRTASAVKAIGCSSTIIGHCEERKDKAGILSEAGVVDYDAVNRILNQEIRQAVNAGLKVLYCIGEKEEEQENWQEVLRKQLEIGLLEIDTSKVVIAYEPVWAIGPGKTPPDADYIKKIAIFIKEVTGGLDVVYGGGLKEENAKMLAEINEVDGGLIALTRFNGDIGFYPEEYLTIIKTYLSE